MPESSILETTAEVSVAFAGFIGIFLALATRDGRFPVQDAFSIRVIVLASVAPVFYSVVPLILHSAGLSGSTLWRVSSCIMGLISGSIMAGMVSQLRALPASARLRPTSLLSLVGWGFSALSFACLAANVVAWPWAPSGAFYLLAVWSIVVVAGTNFVALIFSRVL